MDIPWLTYLLECCCVYLVHPFDLYIFSNKNRQNSLLAVSVTWINVNVNIFAYTYRRFVIIVDMYIDSLQPIVFYKFNSVALVYTPPLVYTPLLYTC